MKVAGIELLKFGHEYQISGVVFNSGDHNKVIILPGEYTGGISEDLDTISLEDWQKLIQQTDLLEVEVGGPLDKVKKALARKTQRQIEQAVSWAVYKRDDYKCRYCANDSIPLTVDHLVLWEQGGPSTLENMVASCKKCNRTRGNTEYRDWLETAYYKKVSVNLDTYTVLENLAVVETLAAIPRVKVIRKR